MKISYQAVLATFLLPAFTMTSLQADAEYKIMLGAYNIKAHAQETVDKFPQINSYIVENDNTHKIHYFAIIDYITSKKEAKSLLEQVHKKVKNAYIIQKEPKISEAIALKQPMMQTTTLENETISDETLIFDDSIKDTEQIVDTPEPITLVSFDENITEQPAEIKEIKTSPIVTATPSHDKNITQIDTTEGLLLKDAILLALKHSYKISSAREKVIQAKRKVDEKLAAYKPTVNLYNNAGGAYLSPYQADEQKFLKSDESLVINQNIYAGGKHSNEIKRERAKLLAAQEKFKDKVEEETVKVIDAYLSLIYQKMGIEITRSNMLSLQKILDIVTVKEESGASSKGDLNYIKSQVENAKSALIKSESKYQNAIAFYEYFIGKLDASTTPIEYTFSFELEDEETILKKMKTHNSKLQVAQAKMDAEKHNLRAQKSKFHPTLDFSITAKDKQSGYVSEPQEDRATALLSLNYNLYNGGKDKAILLGTKSKISELQYKLIDLKEGSDYNTKQLYENIKSAMDALKHTQNEVDANKQVIDSYWAAFKYGTQDIQALLLAQRALNRSQLDVIKEKQAYTNGYFKLMQQVGTLLETLGMEDFTNAKKILQDKSMNYFY